MKKFIPGGEATLLANAAPAVLDPVEGRQLSDHQFRQIRELIYLKSGMYFSDYKQSLLMSRLSKRLVELKLEGFDEYYYFLRYGAERQKELQILFDQITTNETCFFRNPTQLQAFVCRALPDIMSRRKESLKAGSASNRLRILSAGCSTGEEPYSLALLLKENTESFAEVQFPQILAADISAAVLQSAQAGLFAPDSLRSTPEAIKERYFARQNGAYRLSDDIIRAVDFCALNLADRESVRTLGLFDIIFCCNVLIYFDLQSKKKVVTSLYEALRPGGYLFLGPSESLHGVTRAFKLLHLTKAMIYKKEAEACWGDLKS